MKIVGIMGSAEKFYVDTTINPFEISAWLIHSPESGHLFWQDYLLGVIHLRDVEGFPPAHFDFSEATHEVVVYALDKDKNPVISNRKSISPLLPSNFRKQIACTNDAQAAELVEHLVQQAMDGYLFLEPTGIYGARDGWKNAIEEFLQTVKE